jgi:hypothetical protein
VPVVARTAYSQDVRHLLYIALLGETIAGCASDGLPITDPYSPASADMRASNVGMDLSSEPFDSTMPDLSNGDLSTASTDVSVANDLALSPDLSLSCSQARDCPSYVCVGGQCAEHYNDDCATALPLSFVNGVATANSTLGLASNGNQPGDASPTCSDEARTSGPDAVYYFDLDRTADVAVAEWDPDLNGSLWPVIYVRRGSCSSGDASDEVSCASTNGGVNQASVYLSSIGRGRYYVWVDSRSFLAASYALTVSIQ